MWGKLLPDIRIRKITLTNFRNITYAEIEIPGGKKDDMAKGESSILGLYGQNGSGKSSLLMAIKALKTALMGEQFNYLEYASCIQDGADSARLEFEFSAYREKGSDYDIYYSFSIGIDDGEKESNPDDLFKNRMQKMIRSIRSKEKRVVIFDELLQYSEQPKKSKKANKQILIDTSDTACELSGKAFGNKTKYAQFTEGCSSDIDSILNEAKEEARYQSTSFIFSRDVINYIWHPKNESYHEVYFSLLTYGEANLFVVLMHETTTNLMTLSGWHNDEDEGGFGFKVVIDMLGHCEASDEEYLFVESAIPKISSVMSAVVPGMSIELEDLGKTVSDNGEKIHVFDLVSVRDERRIPLKYESEGIRRLISFISLIIAAYNDPTVTVAIDEIDSGLFEYMLGELLEIMKTSAKGQLIFTSHNLRPLEVLPRKNLLFTTNDPKKRFTKLEGISGNNNLRDCYFRMLKDNDSFYSSPDSKSIKDALSRAGEPG